MAYNMLDKIPFLHLTQPSYISCKSEFAQLLAGREQEVQDNASYIDDFENTKGTIDVMTPTSWVISSVPSLNFKDDYNDKTGLTSGYHRSRLLMVHHRSALHPKGRVRSLRVISRATSSS